MADHRHILFVNEFFHPDICASAVVAADHLARVASLRPDWTITVLAGNRSWSDPSVVYPPEEDYRGVRVIRVDRPPVSRRSLLRRGLGFAAFQRGVLAAAASLERVDLVIGTTAPPQGGRLAAKIARRRGCPCIYKVLDLYPDLVAALDRLPAGGLIHRAWLAADTRAMRAAAAVVAVSDGIRHRIARTRGIAGPRLHVIHDGYDPARLGFTGANEFAARFNPEGRFVVQYAGNMGLSHPLDTILDAAALLVRDTGILFQFVGDGPQRGVLQNRKLPNVQWIDFQPADRLGQVLDAAGVCVISQDERMHELALPYKVYAIMAAARPFLFLGSRHSEISRWACATGAGKVLPHGRPGELAAAVVELRDNAGRRGDMASAGRQLFRASFDSSLAAQRWVDLLDSVLAG
jgi:glycosyltransferase involved in cell wall biosynthesis